MPTLLRTISDFLSQAIWGSPIIGWHLVVIAIAVIPFILVSTVFRHRWDAIPGVWRCVILSGIAHVLLIFYAYGTQYVIFTGSDIEAESIPIKIIDETRTDEPINNKSSIPAWDEFSNEQAVPSVEPLNRPFEEPELIIEQVVPNINQLPVELDSAAASKPNFIKGSFALPQVSQQTDSESTLQEFGIDSDIATLPEIQSPEAPTPIDVQESNQQIMAQPEFNSILDTVEPKDAVAEVSQEQFLLPKFSTEDLPISTPPATTEITNLLALPKPSEPIVPSNLAGFIRPDMRPREQVIPRRLGDSQPMPRIYAERAPLGRLEIVKSRGGSKETEAAVERALAFLSANQLSDGRWSSQLSGGGVERNVLGQDRQGAGARADTGITGLALLALLSAGNTQYEGDYRDAVRKGLDFLSKQQTADGCLAGNAHAFSRMYCHSMAMLALSEALAVTGDPNLMAPVERAVKYSLSAQNPSDGGWRYKPGDAGDMSQFGWQVLSIHSASLGGISVPETALHGMQRFLGMCTRGNSDGLGCYRPEEGPSVSMTAEALAVRFLLQETVAIETIDEAAAWILQNPPMIDNVNYYYWYYGTMAMHNAGEQYWKQWNAKMKPVLLAHQVQSGPEAGSWPADGLWAGYGGTVYSTALATLCLESYYRYAPIEVVRQKR